MESTHARHRSPPSLNIRFFLPKLDYVRLGGSFAKDCTCQTILLINLQKHQWGCNFFAFYIAPHSKGVFDLRQLSFAPFLLHFSLKTSVRCQFTLGCQLIRASQITNKSSKPEQGGGNVILKLNPPQIKSWNLLLCFATHTATSLTQGSGPVACSANTGKQSACPLAGRVR